MKIPTLPILTLLLAFTVCARAELTEEQRRVPTEVESPDPKLAKIVLIAGPVSKAGGEHEYFAGSVLMMNWLKQTTGVWPVLVADGWPKNEAILDGAKAIVVYADTAEKLPFLAPERWAHIKRLIDAGTGFVMLHQSADVPAEHADEIKSWLGAVWQKGTGCRGHWDMDFNDIPTHAITRGVAAFHVPFDGWLYNLQFAPGAIPLLSGAVPDKSRTTADAKSHMGRPEVVAWAYERPNGGRSFAFTGCHIHRNWSLENQRKLVTNGILWTAKIEVPANGAPVAFDPASLTANLDAKPAPAPKAAAPATAAPAAAQ
jgi:type 1 glutamine amidotransferase